MAILEHVKEVKQDLEKWVIRNVIEMSTNTVEKISGPKHKEKPTEEYQLVWGSNTETVKQIQKEISIMELEINKSRQQLLESRKMGQIEFKSKKQKNEGAFNESTKINEFDENKIKKYLIHLKKSGRLSIPKIEEDAEQLQTAFLDDNDHFLGEFCEEYEGFSLTFLKEEMKNHAGNKHIQNNLRLPNLICNVVKQLKSGKIR